MSSTTGSLADLHQLHIQLDGKRQQLEGGPRRIKQEQQVIEKKQAEIQATKDELTRQQKMADQKNLEFKTHEQKIADLKIKLNQATNNTEFQILKNQVASETTANSELEEQFLTVTEQIDSLRHRLAELGQQVEAAKMKLKRTTDDVAAAEAGLRESIAALEAEIEEAAVCVPGELKENYRRLIKAYGAGAISSVEGGACSQCDTELSPQNRMELRSGKVIQCKSCGRLLYVVKSS